MTGVSSCAGFTELPISKANLAFYLDKGMQRLEIILRSCQKIVIGLEACRI